MKRGRNQRRRQGGNVNRALDSNGPDVKIRGTAAQIFEKYQALARDAQSAGDRVKAENYLQHAEHYFRVLQALQPPQQQPNRDEDYDQQGQNQRGDNESDAGEGDQPDILGSNENNAAGAADDNGGNDTGGADGGERRQRPPRRRRPRRNGADGEDEGETRASNGAEKDAGEAEERTAETAEANA
ncbi:MAG: DUF4167 domain-containing protein [Pseudomonadota bacterium]